MPFKTLHSLNAFLPIVFRFLGSSTKDKAVHLLKVDAGSSSNLMFPLNLTASSFSQSLNTLSPIEVSPEDTTTYYVIITNGNDCSDTAYFTLNVLPTGIDGYSGIECSVYPNPAKDYVMVKANSLREVHLYSVSGQLIRSHKAANAYQCRIGTADLAPSTYFLQIVTSEGMTTKKIIIRH